MRLVYTPEQQTLQRELQEYFTGLLPPWTGSEPDMSCRFSRSLNGRGLLLSLMSQATVWPHSSIGLTGNWANAALVGSRRRSLRCCAREKQGLREQLGWSQAGGTKCDRPGWTRHVGAR